MKVERAKNRVAIIIVFSMIVYSLFLKYFLRYTYNDPYHMYFFWFFWFLPFTIVVQKIKNDVEEFVYVTEMELALSLMMVVALLGEVLLESRFFGGGFLLSFMAVGIYSAVYCGFLLGVFAVQRGGESAGAEEFLAESFQSFFVFGGGGRVLPSLAVASTGFLAFFAIIAPTVPPRFLPGAASLALWLATNLHTMQAVATRRVDKAWIRFHRALYAATLILTATNIATHLPL